MAFDPYVSEEQKKLLRRNTQQPAWAALAEQQATQGPGALARPAGMPLMAQPLQEEVPTAYMDPITVRPNVASPADLQARGRSGLTRITKSVDANGNSVYSNVGPTPAGAEERWYGAMGNRADATFDNATGKDVAFDVNSEEGQRNLLVNGQRQKIGLGRQLVSNAANDQGLEWERTPTGPRVTTAEQRALAGRGRGAASAPDMGDQIALLRLQSEIMGRGKDDKRADAALQLQERQFGRQEGQDLLKNLKEDPAGTIAAETAALFGASEDEKREFFKSKRGRAIGAILTDKLRSGNQDRFGRSSGLRKDANYGDLVDAPWYNQNKLPWEDGKVVAGDEFNGAVFTPEALGMNREAFDAFQKYYAEENASKKKK